MTFSRFHAAGAAALFASALSPALAAETRFSADLDPAPVSASSRPDFVGEGNVTATLNGSKLTVLGNFSGLASPALDAHLQAGPAMAANGDPFADLTITAGTSGTISGSATLTRAQADALRKGALYVQINTAKSKAPYGTLWGFFMPSGQ